MNILITGANGFIGKNLRIKLKEIGKYQIIEFNKTHKIKSLEEKIKKADLLIHLAGENRSKREEDFLENNINLTENICKILCDQKRKIPIIFSSSIQADLDNIYGKTKKKAEELLKKLFKKNGNPIKIYRLNGVFGKWCKPNYNSVVATFCSSIIQSKDIFISDPEKIINLIYIDDVVNEFINNIKNPIKDFSFGEIKPLYNITLDNLAKQIKSFKKTRNNLTINKVGIGFIRKLYSTYLSYIPIENCSYELDIHNDERGSFVEFLKTTDSGQISYFTAKPGIVRGNHYHHTKSEKFLVIKGKAKFEFISLLNNKYKEIFITSEKPTIVETIPGWNHSIKNIGDEDMIVVLWANEIFDKENPDTYSLKN